MTPFICQTADSGSVNARLHPERYLGKEKDLEFFVLNENLNSSAVDSAMKKSAVTVSWPVLSQFKSCIKATKLHYRCFLCSFANYCGGDAAMNRNLPLMPERREKWRPQNAAEDQRCSGEDATARRQAMPGQEWGEKWQQQNTAGDQPCSPAPAWACFVDACRCRFVSWLSERGIKSPLNYL